MNTHRLTPVLILILVTALLAIGVVHQAMGSHRVHDELSMSQAGACCLIICIGFIANLLAAMPTLSRLNGQAPSPWPVKLPLNLPHLDPPPRSHSVATISI